jgi:nitroreductase
VNVHRCQEQARLHPALAGRFSPVMFDGDAHVTVDQVDTLLESARRAPSAGNSQPWMFIVGRRGDAVHARVVPHLARSSSVWAPGASLLVVNLARIRVDEDTEWEYSEFARFDLGQAVAHMTIQGLAMGLAAHQFRAFDREAVAAEFAVPDHWEVTSMTAFGVPAHAAGEIASAGTSRDRASRAEITWARA